MSSARQTWGVRLRKDEVNDQSKKKKKVETKDRNSVA